MILNTLPFRANFTIVRLPRALLRSGRCSGGKAGRPWAMCCGLSDRFYAWVSLLQKLQLLSEEWRRKGVVSPAKHYLLWLLNSIELLSSEEWRRKGVVSPAKHFLLWLLDSIELLSSEEWRRKGVVSPAKHSLLWLLDSLELLLSKHWISVPEAKRK